MSTRELWCKIGDGGPTKVAVKNNADIDDLKKALFPDARPVDISKITIKTSVDGKALRGDTLVNTIEKNSYNDPLYVTYPEPSTASASAATDQQPAALVEMQTKTYKFMTDKLAPCLQTVTETVFGIRPPPTVRTQESLAYVAQRSIDHHRYSGCQVLASLFGYHQWALRYRACTAHIYDKRHKHEASALGFDVDAAQNTFRLQDHIELEFDTGRLMILPVRTTTGHIGDGETYLYQIHVQEELREEPIQHIRIATRDTPLEYHGAILDWHNEPILFKELHQLEFRAGRVYMRALYEKALYARKRPGHNDLPDPKSACVYNKFEALCMTWDTYWGKRFPSEVGTSPTEQTVYHPPEAAEPPAKRTRL
mmetsp:Transcript_228/g.339  ORF Transcript_228/g.339 Transcript_228/m.339 type:complete len:367 (+) Transcript_228:74-1174(+)